MKISEKRSVFLFVILILSLNTNSSCININYKSRKSINNKPVFITSSIENTKENFGFAISSDPHFFSKNANSLATVKILEILEKYYNDGKIECFFILGDFFDNGGKIENWLRYIKQ